MIPALVVLLLAVIVTAVTWSSLDPDGFRNTFGWAVPGFRRRAGVASASSRPVPLDDAPTWLINEIYRDVFERTANRHDRRPPEPTA